MIKGLIFDFDGTLAETNTLILKAMGKTFVELFGGYTDAQLLACIGPPLIETARTLFPEDPQRLVDTYRKHQFEMHDDMISAYPGVMALLDALQKTGVKMAIVTSKKRDMFLKGLHKLNMASYFEVTVTEDDATHHKPNPESVQLALDQMGLTGADCLMIGDNYHDLLAARAAGVKSVAVSWSIKGVAFLKTYDPDFILEEAMDLFEIVEALGGFENE